MRAVEGWAHPLGPSLLESRGIRGSVLSWAHVHIEESNLVHVARVEGPAAVHARRAGRAARRCMNASRWPVRAQWFAPAPRAAGRGGRSRGRRAARQQLRAARVLLVLRVARARSAAIARGVAYRPHRRLGPLETHGFLRLLRLGRLACKRAFCPAPRARRRLTMGAEIEANSASPGGSGSGRAGVLDLIEALVHFPPRRSAASARSSMRRVASLGNRRRAAGRPPTRGRAGRARGTRWSASCSSRRRSRRAVRVQPLENRDRLARTIDVRARRPLLLPSAPNGTAG